jgi:Zn-dependent protease with chaperone function
MIRFLLGSFILALAQPVLGHQPSYFRDVCEPFAGIKFVPDSNLEGIAQSYSYGVIEFNPELFDSLPVHVQDFIMLHETGHIRLQHGKHLQGSPPAMRKKAELEADAWAASVWPLRWLKPSLINDVYENLQGEESSSSHPSGNERIQRIRAALGNPNQNQSCP